jgi:hypothetical protein
MKKTSVHAAVLFAALAARSSSQSIGKFNIPSAPALIITDANGVRIGELSI